MGELADIVFDCADPSRLARFWAAALDGYEVEAHEPDDPGVLIERPGVRPRLFFQRVPESKVVKNRVHLDLRADDADAEVARLVALGATVAADQVSDDWVILLDPEGNELCVLRR